MNTLNNPQWWLKSHSFVVTTTLHEYIKSHAIPEAEAEYLCYIQNKVIVGSDRAETDGQGYLQVSRQVWLNKCGMTYTRWLDLLTSIGEIEIDHSYAYLPKDASPGEKQTFIPKSKGFKVPADKLASGVVKVDFKKKRVVPLKAQTNSQEDSYLSYILECLKEIRVHPEPIFPQDPLRYAMSKQYLEKTHYQAFGLHRSKVGRVFHSIIEAPRESRVNLKHSSGESLVDVDIKTCHPHLLLPLFTNPKEREAFYKDLQGDIYRQINPNAERDSVKRRVCQYLMAKNRKAEWLASTDVHSYFSKQYPIFWQEKLSQDNGLAWYLQGVESQIVTRELVAYCKSNQYFMVPMHDGCLTLERYKVAIIGELKRLLREHTGYAVRVEEKQIASPRVMKWEAKTGFDLASTDTLAEMTNALNDFKRQYEPLQKRANKEARRNHSPNQAKQTKRQTRVDYILHGPSPTWQVWRECHKAMNALEQEYNQPIRYFAERKQLTTKRRMRV